MSDRAGFTQIPNAILDDPELSPYAKLVYGQILSYAWTERGCFISQDTMADRLGCSDRQVKRGVKELKDAGLVEVEAEKHATGRRNHYWPTGVRPVPMGGDCESPPIGTLWPEKEDVVEEEKTAAGEDRKSTTKPKSASSTSKAIRVVHVANEALGTNWASFRSSDAVVEARRRVEQWPWLTDELMERVVRTICANRWWGAAAPRHPGAVFGEQVWTRAIDALEADDKPQLRDYDDNGKLIPWRSPWRRPQAERKATT